MPRISTIGNYPVIVVGNTPPIHVGTGTGGHLPHLGTPVINLSPIQVAGLIPLLPCDTKECREICGDGWKNPVFGELVSGPSYQTAQTYENDWSTFMVDVSLYQASPNSISVTFELEKFFDGQWRGAPFGVALNNNVFGQYFALGSVSGHPNYTGYSINWGSVLFHAGEGCYRFKARIKFTTYIQGNATTGGTQASCTFILPNNACLAGAIQGTLQTLNGTIPASYSFSFGNPANTIADNVQLLVAMINAGGYPYTAVYNGGQSFSIIGQSYVSNNNITWKLFVSKTGCEVSSISTMRNGVNPEPVLTPVINEACMESPVFDLKTFDCFKAHSTTKFEIWSTGIIGDPYIGYKKHDLCGILLYDSLRTYGYIKTPKSPEYQKNRLKWGAPTAGKIEIVSDEQIRRWEWNSKYLPEYLHTRLSTFMMMADRTFASDYNVNNSDYTIKRLPFIYDSGYEPETIDKEAHFTRRNKMNVQVFFKSGIQSIIHSICCPKP